MHYGSFVKSQDKGYSVIKILIFKSGDNSYFQILPER